MREERELTGASFAWWDSRAYGAYWLRTLAESRRGNADFAVYVFIACHLLVVLRLPTVDVG